MMRRGGELRAGENCARENCAAHATDDECAEKICMTLPSGSFHIHAVASSEPETRREPSGLNATL